MKVVVYAIALNEEQHIERWYESAKDADHLLIADTGSTDRTVEIARGLGIEVVEIGVKPWRFDIARNTAMSLLPSDADWCISMDLDEVLISGWRAALEMCPENITRPRYSYVWSWTETGEPDVRYLRDHIHRRHGYLWKNPVHEVLTPYGGLEEVQALLGGLEVIHLPDNGKPRSQYLGLLKMAVDEDPTNDRNAFYYARELFFHRKYDEAAQAFKNHLAMPTAIWAPERAASMRYLAKIETDKRPQWLTSAVAESPGRREPLVELAEYYYDIQDWEATAAFAGAALNITEKPLDYLVESFAWGVLPLEYMYMALGSLGDLQGALTFCEEAAAQAPDDARIANNLVWLRDQVVRIKSEESE